MTVPQTLSRPREIVAACAKYYGVGIGDVLGDRRYANVARPRHVAMYLMRADLGLSLPRIARQFLCHHTTVLSALRSLDEKIAAGHEVAAQIAEIRSRLSGRQVACVRCARIEGALESIGAALAAAQREIKAIAASAERRGK